MADIRNVGISTHVDAGKATTIERILQYAGKKHTIVDFHETKEMKSGTTTDYMQHEQKGGISI